MDLPLPSPVCLRITCDRTNQARADNSCRDRRFRDPKLVGAGCDGLNSRCVQEGIIACVKRGRTLHPNARRLSRHVPIPAERGITSGTLPPWPMHGLDHPRSRDCWWRCQLQAGEPSGPFRPRKFGRLAAGLRLRCRWRPPKDLPCCRASGSGASHLIRLTMQVQTEVEVAVSCRILSRFGCGPGKPARRIVRSLASPPCLRL